MILPVREAIRRNNMKKHMIICIIFLLIVGEFISGFFTNDLFVHANQTLFDDMPEWKQGTIWTYAIDKIHIEFTDDFYPGLSINVDGSMANLPLKVEEVTSETYELSFKTKINGFVAVKATLQDFSIEGKCKTGWLYKPTIQGEAIVRKNDLALEKLNIQFSGCFVTRLSKPFPLLALRTPIRISISTECVPPFSLIDFPILEEKQWNLTQTSITVDGNIRSFWFKPLNFAHRLARLFSLIPEEFMNLSDIINDFLPVVDIGTFLKTLLGTNNVGLPDTSFYCSSYDTISVSAGNYDVYNISCFDGLIYYYYAPEIGNFAKLSGNLEYLIPFIDTIDMELISVKTGL